MLRLPNDGIMGDLFRGRMALATVLLVFLPATPAPGQTPPPRPLLPIPTARQLQWQYDEMRMFLHFGVNTFTDREWGTGEEDPQIFRPAQLDVGQWAHAAAETGFGAVILTAKHHDGFALWPSRYTRHSVAEAPSPDVVGALARAADAAGVKFGLYLSPWDRHEPTYGDEDAYNAFYLGQLRELMTNYGQLAEVWFDGAKGEDAEDMEYDFDAYWSLVRQLQPGAVIFSDEGPDVRWIGNEHGFAGETNWSTIDRTKVSVGQHGIQDYLNTGEAGGPDWVPGECDTSIRPGWFWHEDEAPKPLERLLEIYFKSVGRNCMLLLNVPPDDRGRLSDVDVTRLREFRTALDRIFDMDLAHGASATANDVRGDDSTFAADNVLDGRIDTYWTLDDGMEAGMLALQLDGEKTFNVVRLQEPVAFGQRVAAYRVEALQAGEWHVISRGTTIGHKKLDLLERPVTTDRLRIHIDEALTVPLLAEVGLHVAPN